MMNDPNAHTQPVKPAPGPSPLAEVDPLSRYQRIRVPRQAPVPPKRRRRKAGCGGCLLPLLALAVPLILVIVAYLFFPGKTTVLLLGIDRAPDGTAISRSDTIMLVSAEAMSAEVHMLSIPRDLWVNIPGYGENRINTAHFFAEGNQEGSGPQAVIDTISANFGVHAALLCAGAVQRLFRSGGRAGRGDPAPGRADGRAGGRQAPPERNRGAGFCPRPRRDR